MTLQKSPTKIIWILTDISKERLSSPQNLGRAASKLCVAVHLHLLSAKTRYDIFLSTGSNAKRVSQALTPLGILT